MACGSSKGKRPPNFSDSDDKFDSHHDIREYFFSNSSSSKRKVRDNCFTSDTDLEDEPIDKSRLKWKKKPRRGIIHSDSDFDDSSSDRDDHDSKSGDDNVCPICLGEFENQLVGVPENCEHTFCIDCIQEWSKKINNCPVDRKKFNLIRIKDSDGAIIQELVVEDVKSNEDVYEDPPTFCQVCNQCDREYVMLLCDGCDNGYHMDCLNPPLEYVPIENWFCFSCAPPTATSKIKEKEKDTDEEKWDDFIDDSPYYDDYQNRNQSGKRRSSGEPRGSRRGQAMTVASNRIAIQWQNQKARRRFTGQTVRDERQEKYDSKQKRKRKGNSERDYGESSSGKSKKLSKRSSRDYVGLKNENKLKTVKSESKKASEQITKQAKVVPTPTVAIYADDLDLDVFNPHFTSKEKSPPRSTIVDTPDVLGHIFDTCSIYISNEKFSKKGSLSHKVEEKTQPEKDAERKKKIMVDPSSSVSRSDQKKDDSSVSYTKKSSKSGSEHRLKSKLNTDIGTCSKMTEVRTKKSLYDDSKKKRKEKKESKSSKDNVSNYFKDSHQKDACHLDWKEKGCSSIKFMKSNLKTIQDCETKEKERGSLINTGISDFRFQLQKFKFKESKDTEDKNKSVYHMHMKKRYSEEKKAKAEEIEQEIKAMKAADNAVGIKTYSTYEGVASFKIPKKTNLEKK